MNTYGISLRFWNSSVVAIDQVNALPTSFVFGHKLFFCRVNYSLVVETATLRLGLHCSYQSITSIHRFAFYRHGTLWTISNSQLVVTSLTAGNQFVLQTVSTLKFATLISILTSSSFLLINSVALPWIITSKIGLYYLAFFNLGLLVLDYFTLTSVVVGL